MTIMAMTRTATTIPKATFKPEKKQIRGTARWSREEYSQVEQRGEQPGGTKRGRNSGAERGTIRRNNMLSSDAYHEHDYGYFNVKNS